MKLSALGEDGIFLMATSSQIERHSRRRLETLGALGEGANETMRRRRRRAVKLRVIGEDAQ
jgi:hypothetical protein